METFKKIQTYSIHHEFVSCCDAGCLIGQAYFVEHIPYDRCLDVDKIQKKSMCMSNNERVIIQQGIDIAASSHKWKDHL